MTLALVVLAAKKFWILDPLYSALGTLLAWFYSVIPSYGVAIVLLTLAVRLVTFPLTAKQAKSQQEMQRVQPELKRLQAKYKNDKQKLNEEMMKLYKEHHVNPFGGCLPLLIQMPVLIVLYRLILGLTHKPNPKNIPTSSSLYHALKASGGKMVSWGIDLAKRAADVKGSKLPFYIVLVVLVVATGYYQQRQLTARAPKDGVNPQMQMMGKVFPLIFGLISWSIPAGVVVYFLVSNIWQIGQQAVIFRRQGPPPDPKGTITTTEGAGDPKKGSSKGSPPERRGQSGGRGAAGPGKSGGGRGRTANARGRDGRTGQKAGGAAKGPVKGQQGKTQLGKGQQPKGQQPKGQPVKGQPVKGQPAKGPGKGHGGAKAGQGAKGPGKAQGGAASPVKGDGKVEGRPPAAGGSGGWPRGRRFWRPRPPSRDTNGGTTESPAAKTETGSQPPEGAETVPDGMAKKPDGQASKPDGNSDGERARSRQAENDKDGR